LPARLRVALRKPFLPIAHHAEVDATAIQIHAADLHPHAGADAVADAGALAAQLLAGSSKRK
jgi:hypothetical protein